MYKLKRLCQHRQFILNSFHIALIAPLYIHFFTFDLFCLVYLYCGQAGMWFSLDYFYLIIANMQCKINCYDDHDRVLMAMAAGDNCYMVSVHNWNGLA